MRAPQQNHDDDELHVSDAHCCCDGVVDRSLIHSYARSLSLSLALSRTANRLASRSRCQLSADSETRFSEPRADSHARTLAQRAPPDEKALGLSRELETLLRSYNLYEPEEDAKKRERVLGKLNVLVQQWIADISKSKVGAVAMRGVFSLLSSRLRSRRSRLSSYSSCCTARTCCEATFVCALQSRREKVVMRACRHQK